MSNFNIKEIQTKTSSNKLIFRRHVQITKKKKGEFVHFKEVAQFLNHLIKSGKNINDISIVGQNPLGWRTLMSFDEDNLKAMDEEEYYRNVAENEKFIEYSQVKFIIR
jgi:hypothetical protein